MDSAEKAQPILRKLGCQFDVVTERVIFVNDHLEEGAAINRALVTGGVEVESLHRRNQSLEEYFISLISRA